MLQQPPASTTPIDAQAQQLVNAVDEILADRPTSYRDTTPIPLVGDAPPVPQPGRPPTSQSATDASTMMLSGGVATVLVGGGVSLVMWASGHADPTVCAIVFGAPAVFILALSRLSRRFKDVAEAATPTHHHYYSGPVTQDSRSISSKTSGVIAKTVNKQ